MKKTALITGASVRIGKSVSQHLAEKGWNILIHYNRSADEAAGLARNLSARFEGQKFETFRADLSNAGEVGNLIPMITSVCGGFELLINNASVFEPSGIIDTTFKLFENQTDINFKAPFFLMRNFARYCKKGNIINFVDTRITTNKSGYAAYNLSKKSLWELTRMAALEFAPEIRVNAIAPGVTIAPAGKDDSYLNALAEKIPMKKPGGVLPILMSIDFILENDHLTGQLLFADGGENLGRNI